MHITPEQNEALTRSGPGTPMGRLFRSYWIPALLASEVAEPDGAPVRVTLLSEKLLAFRDSQGRLGLVDEFCAHRGVSLWFGRNEESGLRCPYHGWKYDVTGRCVEVPSEPPESGYCDRVQLKAYPLLDRGGVLWTYMGDPATRPPEPAHDWATLPAGQVHASKRIQRCNWLQAMEGGLDSIHSSFLHRYSVGEDPLLKRDSVSAALLKGDPRPVFMPAESPGGLFIATRRNAGDDSHYWRVTQWLMPCFNLFPPYAGNPHGGHAWVPIDDESCWTFSVDYHPDRALSAAELQAMHEGAGIHARLQPGSFTPLAHQGNDYLMDRAAQTARLTFSGLGPHLGEIAELRAAFDPSGVSPPLGHLALVGTGDAVDVATLRQRFIARVANDLAAARHDAQQMVKLALYGGDVGVDIGVVKLKIVKHERARPVVHELGALVEKRRVVLIGLDDKIPAATQPRADRKIARHATD